MCSSLVAGLVVLGTIVATSLPCSHAATVTYTVQYRLRSPLRSPLKPAAFHKSAPPPQHKTSPSTTPTRPPSPRKRSPAFPKHPPSPLKRSSPAAKHPPSVPKPSPKRSPKHSPSRPKRFPQPSPKRSPPAHKPSTRASPKRSPQPSPAQPPAAPAAKPSCFRGMYIECKDPRAPKLLRSPAALLAPDDIVPTLLPNDGSITTIQVDQAYYLDGNYTLPFLTVYGRLTCGAPDLPPTPISLSADAIVVNGAFYCGTPITPYTAPVTITLTGQGSIDGTKSFTVTGNISFHGSPRSTWTSLASTIRRNDLSFTTLHPVDWQPGELIVLSSSSFTMGEYEEKVIAAVAPAAGGGTLINVTTRFAYPHWGTLQTFTSPDGKQWSLDERSQVGLLDRNIVIQGDPTTSNAASRTGGQVSMVSGGHAWVKHVKFYLMGEAGVAGSYPLHWHLLGDRQGDYVLASVVFKSWNRCFTVHGTDNVLLERNVCHDHVGHGYMLEDGCEIGNRFRYNLGLTTRRPLSKEAGTVDTDTDSLATYWIVNPLNHFVGNVAAGSAFAGFWMVTPRRPVNHCLEAGLKSQITPYTMSLGVYDHNVAHSCSMGFVIHGGICTGPRSPFCTQGYYPPGMPAVIRNLTTYKTSSAASGNWVTVDARMDFQACTFADGKALTLFAGKQIVFNSLFVGQSANNISSQTPNRNVINSTNWGFAVYDGPGGVVGSYFAGYPTPAFAAIATVGSTFKNWPFFVQDTQFEDSIAPLSRFYFRSNSSRAEFYSAAVRDITGSVSGVTDSLIVPQLDSSLATLWPPSRADGDFMATAACTLDAALKRYICPGTTLLGSIKLNHNFDVSDTTCADPAACPFRIVDVARSDGPQASADNSGVRHLIQFNVILNQNISYNVTYRGPESLVWTGDTPTKFSVEMLNVEVGDSIALTLSNLPTSDAWAWQVFDCPTDTLLVNATTDSAVAFTLTAAQNRALTSGPYPNNLAAKATVNVCPGPCTC